MGKHAKDIHKEDKCNDQPQIEGSNAYNVNTQGSIRESLPREGNIYNNQPHIEDPVIDIEDVQGSLGDSLHVANKNVHNSDDKDIQKGVSFLNATDFTCVIYARKFKTENTLKTHDLKYHI